VPGRGTDLPHARAGHPSRRAIRRLRVDPHRSFVVAVRETHHDDREPTNEFVAIATDGSMDVGSVEWNRLRGVTPASRPMAPNSFGSSWDHPNMPWDSTRLHASHPSPTGPSARSTIEFGNGAEAWVEPGWGPTARLSRAPTARVVEPRSVDRQRAGFQPVVAGPFEVATPSWVFGMQRWAVTTRAHGRRGRARRPAMNWSSTAAPSRCPTRRFRRCNLLADGVVYVGAGYGHEAQVVRSTSTAPRCGARSCRCRTGVTVEQGYLIEPESITFPTGDGDAVAHGLYYPPTNPDHVGPEGAAPPLLVLAHGGPTAQARRQLQLGILYWTSRGIAVVDVDYRGSTGYGRSYRQAPRTAVGHRRRRGLCRCCPLSRRPG
jgi:hypothetical protein